jgi:hypothetical protein
MLAFQTDMEVPKDIDVVRIEIRSYGREIFAEDYPVGEGKVLLPATLGVVAGEDPTAPVTIRPA